MRTMSMARTTPAQKPRGLSKSSVLLCLLTDTIKIPSGFSPKFLLLPEIATLVNQPGAGGGEVRQAALSSGHLDPAILADPAFSLGSENPPNPRELRSSAADEPGATPCCRV